MYFEYSIITVPGTSLLALAYATRYRMHVFEKEVSKNHLLSINTVTTFKFVASHGLELHSAHEL